MNRKTFRALAALNVVLLVALVLVGISPEPAQGQFARSEYIMVSGAVVGRESQDAIYIVNLATAQIAAVLFNSSNNTLELIDGRSLAAETDGRGGAAR